MQNKIHFEIKQVVEESISCLQLEMLSRLLDMADDESLFEGTLKVDLAYADTIEKFRTRCPNLNIIPTSTLDRSALGGITPLVDSTPTVGKWANEMIANIILDNTYSIVLDETHKCYALLSKSNGLTFDDGTVWSGTYGNSFKYIPRVYYNGELVDGNWKYSLSLAPIEDENKYWESALIGTYLAGYVDNKLVSRPNVTPKTTTTMSNFWTYALANGTNYGIYNYFQHQKMNALFMAMYGSKDSKSKIGRGLCDSGLNYYSVRTGITSPLGDGSGEYQYDVTYNQVKLFGIEALWGQIWQFCPNIRFDSNGYIAVVYEGNVVSNTALGRTFTKLNNVLGVYVSKMALGENFDLIPIEASGSLTSHWTVGTFASTDGLLLLVGGNSDHGSLCGLACSTSTAAFAVSNAYIGARLAFYGDLSEYTLVSGAEMKSKNQ